MSLPDELLQLSSEIAQLHPGASAQASQRRAISTAYYAVFHLLAEAAAYEVCQSAPHGLSEIVQRYVEHGHMKKTAETFSRGYASLPQPIQALLPNPIPPGLISVAKSFVSLQDKRHKADYDTRARFTDLEVISDVVAAGQLFRDWQNELTLNPEYCRVFLISLLLDLNKRNR